jgi:hypothetical protein
MGDMSSDAPGPRPRQVTIGGWVIAVASAVLVVTVFDTMANLHTVDTRDRLTEALTSGSLKDLGISLDTALSFVRGALFVAGAAAAVTGVLGIFVLQRHQAARVVLTVAAVPVVLTSPFAGGFLGVVIGGAVALLWTEPARDWFAGRPVRQREPAPAASRSPWTSPDRVDGADDRRPPRLPAPPAGTPSAAPRPMSGWGQVSGPTPDPGPAYPDQARSWPPPAYPAGSTAHPPAAVGSKPPYAVRLACALTWIFSGLTAIAYLVVIVGLAVDRGKILDLVRDNPGVRDTSLTDGELVGALVAASAVVILWCLAACLLALLTWRRHGWARSLLLVSVGVAGLVELAALPYSLLHVAACVVVFGLLLRVPAREWFHGGGGSAAPAPGWPPPDPGSRSPGDPSPGDPSLGGPPPAPPTSPPPPPHEPPSGMPPVW